MWAVRILPGCRDNHPLPLLAGIQRKERFATHRSCTAIVFVAAGYNFDFAAIGEAADPMALLGSLDYSIYAMAGAPLLTLILGAFVYKKKINKSNIINIKR